MAGGGAQSSRGRGKFRKFTRGGGKHFSKNLRPLDADGNEVGMWGDAAEKRDSDDSSEEDEEEDSDEESDSGDDAAAPGGSSSAAAAAAAELSREERKKEKKARKDAAIKAKKGTVQVGDMPSSGSEEEESEDEVAPANPNHSRAARNQTKKPPATVEDVADDVKKMTVTPGNKREREALAAQEAKERYRRQHEAGKTDEAKADLARLQEIRKKREEESARKLEEKAEKEALDRAKRADIDARENKRREAAMGPQQKNKKKK